jgi:hypothetical protein
MSKGRIKRLKRLQILIIVIGLLLFFFAMGAGSEGLVNENFAGVLWALSVILLIGGLFVISKKIKKELAEDE